MFSINKIQQNKIIYFVLFIFCFTKISAQTNITFSKLTITDGLSHNNVYSILQDKYGFMWFATQNGLNRYDGYNFKLFYHKITDNNSISSNNINKIIEDNKGNLWMATHQGIDCYNPIEAKFKHLTSDKVLKNHLSSNNISYITIDKASNVWAATSGGGLNKINTKSLLCTHYLHSVTDSNSISSNDVYAIEADANNNLWIGTNKSLDYFDTKNNNFKHYRIGYESYDEHKHIAIRTLLLDSRNILWIGTSNGLFTLNIKTHKITEYKANVFEANSISDNNINALIEDANNNIWIATDYGLNKYSLSSHRFTNYLHNSTTHTSINHNKIVSLYQDKFKVLWIGTEGGGVNKLDLKQKKFYHWNKTNKPKINTNISAIAIDSDLELCLGTNGGGISVCEKNNNILKCKNSNLIINKLLPDVQILSLCYHKNKLYIGMQTGGLGVLSHKNDKYTLKTYQHTGDSTGISNNQVNAVIADKDGFLWIATRNGLNKMIDTNETSGTYFLSYKQDFSKKKSLCDNHITTLFKDNKGFLWVGTYNKGVDRINTTSLEIKHFENKSENSKSPSGNSINCITQDNAGNIWIATVYGGLNKLNPDSTSFKNYTTQDGFTSNEIMSILEDDNNNLWIATSKGIIKLNTKTEKINIYDNTDGIINDGFNRNAGKKDKNGWMYFGTNSGLVYFHPEQIKLNTSTPDIVITNFTFLDNKKWTTKDFFISKYNNKNTKVLLNNDENIFSIEFAALDYTNPQKNKYKYKIDEIHEDWIDYGTQHKILLSSLSSGKYTFRIKGSNSDGVFNNEELLMNIEIKPSFSETKIFYVIILLAAIIAFIWIYSYLIKIRTNKLLANKNSELQNTNLKLLESEKNLKQLNEAKDKFLSIIAHDLRNPFSPLLSLTELLDLDYDEMKDTERREQIKEIHLGAKRLYDLLENLLHWSLSQTKRIKFNPKIIDFNALVELNIELLNINAEKKGINLIKNFDGNYNVIADENMINSVMRNLLNNAIKFSDNNTQVIVNIEETDDNYIVEIKDQGKGIAPENIKTIFQGLSKYRLDSTRGTGSGLGLMLCYEFVEKNGGKIWVKSTLNKGSSFFFSLKKA